MGQKVHPRGFRLGVLYSWPSKWFGKKNFRDMLQEDTRIRSFLERKLKEAGVAGIEIQRSPRLITVTVQTSRPGLIIGRGGAGVEQLKNEVKKQIAAASRKMEVKVNIEEIRNPYTHAKLVAQSVAEQLEKRVAFRRIMKQMSEKVMEAQNVKGVKIALAGRLNGADMGRREWLAKGNIPLHTIRANIDFACATARTTYGAVGVKVWIYTGEVFERTAAAKKK